MKRKLGPPQDLCDSIHTDVVGRPGFRPGEAVLDQFIEAFGPRPATCWTSCG